jgi:HEPN domain-containing protein
MIIKADNASGLQAAGAPANFRCPGCGQLGTFELLIGNSQDIALAGGFRIGERRCPNSECRALIFVIWQNNIVIRSYPALRIDFDKTNIPGAIVSALEEAITCHANECFIAAAIMVRKTLEEMCRERGAKGKDLKERIRDLGTKIVLPSELLNGLDDLRLLGNDAAHIESREYDQVGKEEAEIGIEFTKEVLKAMFQYSALLNRLRGLKKTP